MTERDSLPPRAPTGDDDFAREAGNLLRRSGDDIDAVTAARLARARQAALAEMQRRRAGWLVPALAAAAVGAVGLWVSRGAGLPATPAPVASVPTAEVEALAGGDSLEMFEDLEFYVWLDTAAAVPGAAGEVRL